ncbi:MAG: ABC transporter ATP-binding protein [Dehalococcoidia bacterium]
MQRRMNQRPTGSKRAIFARVLGLFRPYRARFSTLLLLIAAGAVLDLLPALLIKRIVDEATRGAQGSLASVNLTFALLVATIVANGLIGVATGYTNQTIGQGIMFHLRSELHQHLQRLSVRFFTQTRTGEILSRVSTDVNGVQDAVTGTFTDFISNALTLLVAIGLMYALQWQLTVAALVILPLWVFPTVKLGGVMRRLIREWHEESAALASQLEETLSVSGSMLVKTFGRQEHEAARFEEHNQRLRSIAMRRLIAGRWFNMATGLFGGLAPALIYWYGGRAVIGESLTLGSVVAMAVLTQRVFQPFAAIARVNTTVLSSLALFERIFDYLDLPLDVQERPNAVNLPRAQGALRFEHVSFAYAPDAPLVLRDIDIEVGAGQMVALVGPSGAGKTTVTYLLQRFYDPVRGRVLLDGHDLRDLTLASVANAVGAVMQDTFLFHSSLADNIRYGRLDARDDEVRAAATAAGLDEMIARLQEGLDTVVGERGYRLSGGEKQRVAIARAILKDPPILVLDEATASLDSQLEREIRESTARLARERTTVVIAHRLSTVLAADVIFVFDRGAIVERGRHEELLALGGLYASLYREQFEAQAEGALPPAPSLS